MECKISINLVKEGVPVRTIDDVAHAEGHPGVTEFFSGLLDDIFNLIKTATFYFLVRGVASIVPFADIYVSYMEAKAEAQKALDICNDILGSSNSYYSASAAVQFDESDEFDEIQIIYYAWSEDSITKANSAFVPKQAYSQGVVTREDKKYIYGANFKTRNLEGGKYPFVFGAVDSGMRYKVATFSHLTLEWRKKPKPNCTSLRQLSRSIDPPSSLRSLKDISKILNVSPPSLKECCMEQAKCLSIQESHLTIFEHNAALFPDHLAEIDIFGVKSVPFYDLYEGTNRQEAIDSFIGYIMEKKPDVIGFCELWIPEERTQIRKRLSEIYHFDSDFYAEGPIGGAPGLTTIMDGGLLLLSKFPIMTRDQIIYSSCACEDCFSAKGALYAGILIPGYPSLINVFLTHMQSCPPKAPFLPDAGSGDGCWEKLKVYQIKELRNFIQNKASQGPCILMGDFNLGDYYNDDQKVMIFHTEDLIRDLGNPIDIWYEISDRTIDVFWPGSDIKTQQWDMGRTKGGAKGFEPNNECLWNDKGRLGQTIKDNNGNDVKDRNGNIILIGDRIDYIFGFKSSDGRYRINFDNCKVLMILYNEKKDVSDHYGLLSTVKSICERKKEYYNQ